ncbi:putative peptidoglycan glycosyltransferase FtsW [Fibrobacter sp. UWH4]|uniref:peptidoglycan glycosyltransferase FtsW n=1 Tax=Fibrobacter sp. UWH4 TaxID=1896210 RepID=UPI000918F71F|nr:putative peptidoglycan glycosyltransferase FtsW [Fibrobacter sp. UWH4]SHK24683.1 cell division protein FtsW [Fibrobacter sp. UWH4]
MENTAAHTGMNKLLLIAALLLICIGVPIIYTASSHFAVAKGLPAEFYLQKHLVKVVGGLVLMFICARFVDYGHWSWLGRITFVIGVVLTIAALVKGGAVKGANRWIFGIQPSEIMKLGMLICICWKFSQAGDNIKSVACTLVQPGIFFGITALLLILQPNYSMIVMLSFVVGCVMITAGVNLKYLAMTVGALAPLGLIMLLVTGHSSKRIHAFFADEGEMVASNWQGDHALQALGNGGFTGTGFGMGVQKLGYLPEAHKDVIYAVAGEEFGFVGTFVLLALYAILFAQGFKIARQSSTRFGKYLAVAFTYSLFFNFLVHVCVCVGLFPMTGQPLPFITFGGTNLIYSCVVVGILLNISRPNTGKMIKEPYMSGASLESSAYRNVDFTRSGV